MKKIQILGMGCANCKRLEKNARTAVEELGIKCEVEKVEDIEKIMSFGVMATPGLAVDGKVVSAGEAADTRRDQGVSEVGDRRQTRSVFDTRTRQTRNIYCWRNIP